MKAFRLKLGICAGLLIGLTQLYSQSPPGVFADSNHPAGPPDPQSLDAIWQVDPITDQVSIKIPFTTTPQGGRGPKLPFALLYNSASTVTLQAAGSYPILGSFPASNFDWLAHPYSTSVSPNGPWTTTGPYIYYSISNEPSQSNPTFSGCTLDGPFVYVDQNGSAHDMNLLFEPGASGPPNPQTMEPVCYAAQEQIYYQPLGTTSATTDGSSIETSSGQAISPDGTRATGSFESGSGPITPATATLTDPNGNSAKLALSGGVYTATDALGRTAYTTNIPIGIAGQIPAGSYYVKTYDESGNPETYTIVFSKVAIGTFTMPHPTASEISSPPFCSGSGCNFNASVNPPAAGDSLTAVTEVERPDSTAYTFAYDATYGTISRITFPTGGYVRFCWNIRDKDWSPYGQASVVSSVVVVDAFISPGTGSSGGCDPPAAGSGEDQWTYAMESLDNSSTPIGQVTAPDGSYTKYGGTCFDFADLVIYEQGQKATCKESSRSMYSSSGTLLRSIIQSFNGQALPTIVATNLFDGPSPMQQIVRYTYDAYNNVTEKDESDYNSCSGSCLIPSTMPSWLRSTYTQYSSAMLSSYIVDKPAQIVVTNGTGTPYSLANYGYNSYGNLTNESKCISISGTYPNESCSAFWQTQYTPDAHGQVTQKVDGDGTSDAATTNYTWTGPSGTSDSYNGYLTTIAYPNGSTDGYTYFADTGQTKSHVDWNKNTTSYDYSDPSGHLNRITSITLPITTDGTTNSIGSGDTIYNYEDSPPNFSVEEQTAINSLDVSTTTTSYFDGLGRKTTTKTVSPSCSSPIEVDTVYDSMSRVSTVSNPYCTTSDPTYGLTTFVYDGLGRKKQTTTPDGAVSTITYGGNATEFTEPSNGTASPQHIQQVNGIGQLLNLCEISATAFGGTSPSNCGLNISGSGFLTSYTFDPLDRLATVSQHGIGRSFGYDSLGRLTTAMNPEAGTTTYVYSTPSAPCSPDPDSPCSKTDARGAVTNYGYDNMSRLISKKYTGNSGSTSLSCYQYDTSSISGAGGNLLGHLTNAWTLPASSSGCTTSPGSPGSFLTLKSYLSYDALGRPLSVQEQACVNGICSGPSPYQVGMSYDFVGDLTTLTNPVGANGQSLTLRNYFDALARPCATTSSWTAEASPNLFVVNPSSGSPGYSPGGGLQNFYLGSTSSTAYTSCTPTPASPINEVHTYSKRFWMTGITAGGQIP